MIATILIGLSDTQVITGLALMIPTLYIMKCEILTYHYNLMCNLCVIASTSYFSSAFIVHGYSDSEGKIYLWGVFLPLLLILTAYMKGDPTTSIFPSFKPNDEIGVKKPNTGLMLPAVYFLNHLNKLNFTGNPQKFTASQL
jgi:hypothetical protein